MRIVLMVLALLMGRPAAACGVELVLAVDVSRSVVNAEYNLQMGGLASALRHPDVIDAIVWTPGGVMAVLTQWSGPDSQHRSTGWHHLTDRGSVLVFANAVDGTRRQFFGAFTAVGNALIHAGEVGGTNPRKCRRRVIDISGDGASNRGKPALPVAEALAASGVTVNALVIRGATPDPVTWYHENVVRGPGAFLESARDFADYPRAMTRKLLRELSPAVVQR